MLTLSRIRTTHGDVASEKLDHLWRPVERGTGRPRRRAASARSRSGAVWALRFGLGCGARVGVARVDLVWRAAGARSRSGAVWALRFGLGCGARVGVARVDLVWRAAGAR